MGEVRGLLNQYLQERNEALKRATATEFQTQLLRQQVRTLIETGALATALANRLNEALMGWLEYENALYLHSRGVVEIDRVVALHDAAVKKTKEAIGHVG